MSKYFSITLVVLLLLLFSTGSFATNGHQLSAIGAYQQGMAGAVTAAPYDASTAITNPAGMAMIGSRTDFSFQGFFPRGDCPSASEAGLLRRRLELLSRAGHRLDCSCQLQGDLFFGGGMYGVSGHGSGL